MNNHIIDNRSIIILKDPILKGNNTIKQTEKPSPKGCGQRNRKPDHCKRCGAEGRRRSWENKRYYGVYACKECLSMTDGKAALLKIRREEGQLDIIADYQTTSKFRINLLDKMFRATTWCSEDYNYILVGHNIRQFRFVAEEKGINCKELDFTVENRRDMIEEEINLLSGTNSTLLLYPAKSMLDTIKHLQERGNRNVIVLANEETAEFWNKNGVLPIFPEELPKQRKKRTKPLQNYGEGALS